MHIHIDLAQDEGTGEGDMEFAVNDVDSACKEVAVDDGNVKVEEYNADESNEYKSSGDKLDKTIGDDDDNDQVSEDKDDAEDGKADEESVTRWR